MHLIFSGLKKAVLESWGELINLIFYNLFCFLTMLPAVLFFSVTIADISLWTLIISGILLVPSSIFLFALYEVAYGLNKGNVVKFVDFFHAIRHSWRQALVWGGVNLLVLLILIGNVVFYSQFVATWAGIVQFIVWAILVVWAVIQLFVLPMYPHLRQPGFRLALKNSMAITSGYALPVLTVAILTGIILTLTLFFQFLAFFFTFFAIAMFSSSMLAVILDDQFGPSEDSSE